ncbi:glycosyltransferase [Bacillus sp. ISL-75]|uniref:glycosyltransferase n=1 Tax=Bacillus sp. ISL-75 TaxID=2819137 RepID=UPI001BE5CD9F|nr:glycosyltransferase [Bacillus sp. ISL-75]MBT2727809.1 glycosyltransferase [Bacillus sp. ISL-75]
MARTETIDFKQFVKQEKYPVGDLLKMLQDKNLMRVVSVGGGLMAVMVPKSAWAATKASADQTFGNLWEAVMNIVDWIVVGVFVFGGVAWMFGHRPKALELLIGGSAGYILARHAIDIRDFLKKL